MLTTKPTNLPNVALGLHLWDSQSHINTHAPAVQPILDELRRRGMATDGKTLVEHFKAVPYGWEPVVLRVILAALFRAGTIAIEVGQRYFTDPGETAAQEALTKSAIFNKALFDYDPTGGLSLDQRREARRQIDLLFGRQVDDTTNTLVKTLQGELGNLKADNKLFLAQVQGINLPVPDRIYQGEGLLDKVLGQAKPDGVVKAFLAQKDGIANLKQMQERLQAFLTQGYHTEYGKVRRLAEAIERTLADVTDLDTEMVRNALDDLRALESARTIVERWGDVQRAAQTLQSAYKKVYTDLFARRTTIYAQAHEQVKSFGLVPSEITSRIVTDPSGWDDSGLGYAGQPATLLDLYNDIQLVEQRQVRAIAALQAEREQRSAKRNGEQSELREGVVTHTFIQVRDYLSGEIADEAVLADKLEAFATRVREELSQGRTVLIK